MNNIREYGPYMGLVLFWSACLVTGGFNDQYLAQRVYLKDNAVAVIFSVIGLYMIYGSFVFFLGIILRQLLVSENRKHIRCIIWILCSYFAFSTSTYSAAAILSDSVCGFLIQGDTHSLAYYVVAGLFLFFALYPAGFILNKKRYDKEAVHDLILILITATLAVFLSNIVKGFVMRPRYRIALKGYEGIGFIPVFHMLKDGKSLLKIYGLKKDDLASFFSGHAMNSMLCIMILPAYRYVFDKLKGKEKILIGIAIVSSLPITFSRMVLGDHYLSDISFGAIAGLVIVFIYQMIRKKLI